MEPIERGGGGNDNTHRTLKQLVLVDAWFIRDPANLARYTLHADVSFNEERLSGGKEASIVFRVAVKQCEIVFQPPQDKFTVDRSSVRRTKPLTPEEIKRVRSERQNLGISGFFKMGKKTEASTTIEGGRSTGVERTASSTRIESMFNERFLRSRDGHDAWRVNGEKLPLGRLDGPVFDADNEPRLTLVDLRSHSQLQMDTQRGMLPSPSIRVHCRREDIDIFDIRFAEEDRQSLLDTQFNKKQKMIVASQVLRDALLVEGLSAGDLLSDPFAEMIICDVTIPLVDQRTQGS